MKTSCIIVVQLFITRWMVCCIRQADQLLFFRSASFTFTDCWVKSIKGSRHFILFGFHFSTNWWSLITYFSMNFPKASVTACPMRDAELDQFWRNISTKMSNSLWHANTKLAQLVKTRRLIGSFIKKKEFTKIFGKVGRVPSKINRRVSSKFFDFFCFSYVSGH